MAKAERKTAAETADANRLDFESQFDRLNACVADLESGRLSLDESLKAYRDGIELVSRCRAILEQAQARVESIEAVDESGAVVTAPLDLETDTHQALRRKEQDADPDEEPF